MQEKESGNLLGLEKSPYLLQHKDNPVHWRPWGAEAFAAAKKDDKPIFLSIGYSTCYWCHVMEKDSFELEEVAAVLNRYFIPVKVDREERPDVDQIYMDAVVALTGHGGWPMSVFLTPDGRPFWGGTFFYRAQFISVLEQLHQAWVSEREKVLESAAQIVQFISRDGAEPQPGYAPQPELLQAAYRYFEQRFDALDGGFGPAPKFPPSMQLGLLFRLARRFERPEQSARAQHMACFTLEKMARGGIFDHLGGGFHRYSTDAEWLVPHFEKMLYDNALLAVSYLEAYQYTGSDFFAQVAREIFEYVLRDMTSPQGGFFSAEDAGEVGKEGEYYVWSADEVKEVLTAEEYEKLAAAYGITNAGNFEGHTILTLQADYDWSVKAELAGAQAKLFARRKERPAPHKDDKILTAWNGLMLGAFAKGYQVLGDDRYLQAAKNCADFIGRKLYGEGGLLRSYRDGEAKYQGYVEDYAYLIEGLLNLYEAAFDPAHLRFAEKLQAQQDEKFWDESGKAYYFTEAEDVPVRKKDLHDGAVPSANSVAAMNLLRLHGLFGSSGYRERFDDLISALAATMERYPAAYPRALQAIDYRLDNAKEVALIRSEDAAGRDMYNYLHAAFLPNKVLAAAQAGSGADYPPLLSARSSARSAESLAYVCEDQRCGLPVSSLSALKPLLDTKAPL